MPYRRTPAIQVRLDAQRSAIIDAATAVLAADGYGACSVAAVAGRAGVAAGTVYRHFDSKGALVAEVFRAVVGREVQAVRNCVRVESQSLDQIAAVITTFARRALTSPRLAYALLAEPLDDQVAALRLEFRTEFRDIVAAAIVEGVEDGRLPPQNAAIVAAALIGAIAEALVGPLATRDDDPIIISTLVQFAHRSLGAFDAAHA